MFICMSIPQISKAYTSIPVFRFFQFPLEYVTVLPNAIIHSLTRHRVVDKRHIVREFPVRQPLASDSATP